MAHIATRSTSRSLRRTRGVHVSRQKHGLSVGRPRLTHWARAKHVSADGTQPCPNDVVPMVESDLKNEENFFFVFSFSSFFLRFSVSLPCHLPGLRVSLLAEFCSRALAALQTGRMRHSSLRTPPHTNYGGELGGYYRGDQTRGGCRAVPIASRGLARLVNDRITTGETRENFPRHAVVGVSLCVLCL